MKLYSARFVRPCTVHTALNMDGLSVAYRVTDGKENILTIFFPRQRFKVADDDAPMAAQRNERREERAGDTGRVASNATYGRDQRQCFGNNTATRYSGAENYPDRCRF